MSGAVEQLTLFDLDTCAGRTSQEHSVQPKEKTSASSSRRSSELKTAPVQCLDLTPGAGNLLGEFYWELISPWRGGASTLNTGVSPRDAKESSLSQILQADPPLKYYLSPKACLGILRRAFERGKELPKKLERALKIQAGLMRPDGQPTGLEAYHINQRDEGIDLHGVSGALMATTNMQMQTFVTQPDEAVEGFDGYNGDLTGDVAATLGVNCGMSTGRNGVMAFAANQRDEVRDLHDVAAALAAQPGMKQQTFVAGITAKGNGDCFLSEERHTSLSGGGGMPGQGYPSVLVAKGADTPQTCLTPWDTQQQRVFLPCGKSPTVAGADGGGGRNPAGLVFTAGFCAGASPAAGSIGYQAEVSPTLRGSPSGNMMPSVLCLNDQGGSIMACSEDVAGTLRAQEHGHQPLIVDKRSDEMMPALYENHGIDARYTGPHAVAPTMSARYGTGGNNVPLIAQETAPSQEPAHAMFSRQRVDVFREDAVASTQSARQHKDATDLVMDVAGLDCRNGWENGDLCGTLQQGTTGSSLNSIHPVRTGQFIRRLTPLECERLQGFPDHWTDLPGASDSARYKALGNSVAIPCVDFVLRGIAWFLRQNKEA